VPRKPQPARDFAPVTDIRRRHPEKAHKPDNPIQPKPAWIRVKAPTSAT